MPNAWNIGSALNTLSTGLKSTTDGTCAQLASSARWLCTTPFGAPSDPEVNSTSARRRRHPAGARQATGTPRGEHPAHLVRSPIEARTSSR